ncbi:putative protein kinase [Trypanosoma grayi]|uniref:putative protein kinase n=1 Tax=Trypanosoma grayi TaxID=71804 RepID=UPI0004F419CE|nr:putative protein kinase [Trypanosoma grayi]KEG08223.1 putative protein kinase [Trypanosoma grayi]
MGCTQSKGATKDPRKPAGAAYRRNSRNRGDVPDHVPEGSDIEPFAPSPSLRKWYDTQLEEGRKYFRTPSPPEVKTPPPGVTKKKKKQAGANLPTKQKMLTLYHVAPLKHVVGKGQYSQVMLAEMTVRTTTADALVKDAIEVQNKGKLARGSPSETGKGGQEVVATGPKYLISCKEYELVGESTSFVFNRLRDEVHRLARLSFSSRLLKVLQMESVYENSKEGGANVLSGPEHLAKGRSNVLAAASGGRQATRKLSGRLAGQAPHQPPDKVRIYMEYAKYGTLQNALLTEIPKKFGKTYMHELTARAYLREVLVALAFLHENNTAHTDLCAKNVYIMNNIGSVYATCFPAYIADLPAGRFAKVPAGWVRRVLALMDPASMQPQYNVEFVGSILNDSIVSHLGWNPNDETSRANGPGDAEPITAEKAAPTQPPSEGNKKATNANAPAEENEVDDEGCRWVDDEVKLYLQGNDYTDDDTLPLPSPGSSVGPTNVFKSPNSEGLTIVHTGSFFRSPPMQTWLLPPHPYSSVTSADCGGAVQNNNSISRSVGDPVGDSLGPSSGDLAPSAGGHAEHGEASLAVRSGRRRPRKPLIKLGHYGLIRSILVGDGEGTAHKLGCVTHLAPEVMRRAPFTPESDIYAFAMMFIELTTPNGDVFADLRPKNMPLPHTREEKTAYDSQWLVNIKRYLMQHDNVVPLPPQLSDECKAMLRQCLRYDPTKRPTAVELLQTKYFLLGHWVNVATKEERMEAPWLDTNYEAAAQASGLPRLPSEITFYQTRAVLRSALGKKNGDAKQTADRT